MNAGSAGSPPFGELVLSVMTIPDADFEDRVAAAAAAGYGGIGLRPKHRTSAHQQGLTDADLRAVLEDNGVSVVELEVLSGWGADGDEAAASRTHEEEIYQLADALGGRHMTVTGTGLEGPVERSAERFAAVCDRAAAHGLRVALEFLPWTAVPDADHARAIVELAGRPNGGVLVDTWHHFRGAASDEQLRALPREMVVAVQFDDDRLDGEGTLFEQTFHRLLPGQGAFALVHFLHLMADLGVTAPLCVEVISDLSATIPAAEMARRAAEATRAVMAEAFPT